jgi:hypothetical protein
MSYFKNLYKTAIDSLIKGYVDAAAIKQQQQNPIPENLVLATLSDVYNATFVSGVDDSIFRLKCEHSLVSSQGFAENNDYQTVADSLLYGGEGLMFEDPLMSCLGSFYKYSRQIGPHKANQEITFEKTYQTEGAGDFAIITGISENNNGIYSFDIQGFGINLIQNYFVPTFGQTDGYDIAAKIQNMKSFDSNYVPKNLYRFSKQYFEHGIQFFEFRDPATSNNNSYVDPLYELGFQQQFAVHFDFSVYDIAGTSAYNSSVVTNLFTPAETPTVDKGAIFNSVPLTLLTNLKLKNEGTGDVYEIPPQIGYEDELLEPRVPGTDPIGWDGVYIDKYNRYTPEQRGKLLYDSFLQSKPWFKGYRYDATRSRAAITEEAVGLYGDELLQNDPIADIRPVYNFASPNWEKNMPESELMIGNIYTYAKGLDFSSKDKLKFNFDEYGIKLKNCSLEALSDYKSAARQYGNIVFLESIEKLNQKAETAKSQFPMYNEVTFMPETAGPVYNLMKECNMDIAFLKFYMNADSADWYTLDQGRPSVKNGYVSYKESKINFLFNQGYVIDEQRLEIISKLKIPGVYPATHEEFSEGVPVYTTTDDSFDGEPNVNIGFLHWMKWYVGGVINDTEHKLYDTPDQMSKQTFFYKNTPDNIAYPQESKTGKLVDLVKFLPSFKKIVSDNLRHPHDIYSAGNINADLCYSETLFYEIEKKVMKFVDLAVASEASSDSDSGAIKDPLGVPLSLTAPGIFNTVAPRMITVQKIYIPVSNISDYIKYIDTQVKYGKKYTYTINEIKMVFGSEYRHYTDPSRFNNSTFLDLYQTDAKEYYKNPITGQNYHGRPGDEAVSFVGQGPTGVGNYGVGIPLFYRDVVDTVTGVDYKNYRLMIMDIEYRPDVRIMKTPLYREPEVVIVDKPPLPPLTNVYPISGQKNKILLTLENQSGERDLEPIPFSNQDASYFDVVRKSQKRTFRLPSGDYYKPSLTFASDDAPLSYEVYRIKGDKPRNYNSFINSLYKTLDLQNYETSLEDTIETNTKYYYTFRTIDRHKNVSNPSPIYEVEMVENSDITYPIIKLCEFDNEKEYSDTKRFRRFLMVDAADQQVFLNEEETQIDGSTAVTGVNPVLGTATKSIWNGKRFKFRIRSRDTGRALDLNLSFKTEHVTTEDEKVNLCD